MSYQPTGPPPPPSHPPLRRIARSSNSLSGRPGGAAGRGGGRRVSSSSSHNALSTTETLNTSGRRGDSSHPAWMDDLQAPSISSQLPPFCTSLVREQSLALGILEQRHQVLDASAAGSSPPLFQGGGGGGGGVSFAPAAGRSWSLFSDVPTSRSPGSVLPPSVHFTDQQQPPQQQQSQQQQQDQGPWSIWPQSLVDRRKRAAAEERAGSPSGLSLLLNKGNNSNSGNAGRRAADADEGDQEVVIDDVHDEDQEVGGGGHALGVGVGGTSGVGFLPSSAAAAAAAAAGPSPKPHQFSSSFFAPSRSASAVGLAFRDASLLSGRFRDSDAPPYFFDENGLDYPYAPIDYRRGGGSYPKSFASSHAGFVDRLRNAFGGPASSSATWHSHDQRASSEADRLLPSTWLNPGGGGGGGADGGGGGGNGYNSTGHYSSTDRADPESDLRASLEKSSWNRQTLVQKCLIEPVSFLPAVVLGLLLNLLDAVSYGMIIFPLNTVPFQALGPDGISMFFVSCIISQTVFSLGGSAFRGSTGGMMIEVVPFLHLMAETVVNKVGAENRDEVLATTILAFALSAVMTGAVFMSLGFFKLGSLIGFFPRHILVGCIGGVGWFLIVTGFEVSSRMTSELTYSWETFKFLFLDRHVFALWFSAFALALLLRGLQTKIRHPFLVPVFFMAVPALFYIVVAAAGLEWDTLRDEGWVFPMPEGNAPGWQFYSYFDIKKTHWGAVLETVPAMMALTFFGILHVPINVPALGVSTGQDDVDINRELVAHGWSNMISGCFGTLQNYLVYTNSVLFIKSGGDSRVAGMMLATATLVVFLIGPWIVGYIPVMVVGSLIFHLGMDLVKEALWATWGLVHRFEYVTIVLIVVFMAGLGFVEGIFLGILLACIFFVVTNSRKEGIRFTCTGASAKSTVRRVYRQQKFLRQVGRQIHIFKLQGDMFFGTINKVEVAIQDVFERRRWESNPIRFLVLDFSLVRGVDFSAAEGFGRIRRNVRSKGVWLVLAGLDQDGEMAKALHMEDGIWGNGFSIEMIDTRAFPGLSEALEFCENCLLEMFYKSRESAAVVDAVKRKRALERTSQEDLSAMLSPESVPTSLFEDQAASSPRKHQLFEAARETLMERDKVVPQVMNLQQPIPTLLAAFHDTRDNPTDFFLRLSMYFERRVVSAGTVFWTQGGLPTDGVVLVELGTLRSVQEFQDSGLVRRSVEVILPGTISGEIGLFTGRDRIDTLISETDGVVWGLSQDGFQRMVSEDSALAVEFMRVAMSYSAERLNITTAYAFSLS